MQGFKHLPVWTLYLGIKLINGVLLPHIENCSNKLSASWGKSGSAVGRVVPQDKSRSGCVAVGRAVASYARDPWFESSHYLTILQLNYKMYVKSCA